MLHFYLPPKLDVFNIIFYVFLFMCVYLLTTHCEYKWFYYFVLYPSY